MEQFDAIIVGAGQAGAQTAVLLRQQGFAGRIALIGEEPELPYDRPPLSKEYLSGKKSFDQLMFRSASAWDELGVTMVVETRIVAVNPVERCIETASGTAFGYGVLVWATGGAARRLACPGADARGVHAVRTRADVDAILAGLGDAGQVAIVGGGYIGLETAAALSDLGKRVVIVEMQDRVLARVAGEPIARFYETEHRARGVEIRLGVGVSAIETHDDAVTGVRLTDGTSVAAAMVIVGVGIEPEISALTEAGAEVGNGVRIDEYCRTSLPGIFAIGDCAEHRNAFAHSEWVRLESIQNANDQAATVAKAICGDETPYHALPWFWSNQYDLKLQTVGLSQGHDDLVVRGDPAARSFSVVYFREGRVVALDCVNSVRDYSHGRALILAGAEVSRDAVADASVALRSLMAAR